MRSGLVVLVSILFMLFPRHSTAQTSIGFANSADLGTLLDYRLPDWGYRTTHLSLEASGRGLNEAATNGNFATATESLAQRWYRESESRTWSIAANQQGQWSWDQQEENDSKSTNVRLLGKVAASGNGRAYQSELVSVVATATLEADYYEALDRDHLDRALRLYRRFHGSLRPGIGVGRLRDVTPLLRALRLSERLEALGRSPLSEDDVTQVAQALSRQGGYSAVFDRSDRRFWGDVLGPLAGGGSPLSPFEVFYLREASFEDLGSRREGYQLDGGFQLTRSAAKNSVPADATGPWLAGSWSHNVSLNHQISMDFSSTYLAVSNAREAVAAVTGSYLWILADRVAWNNSLQGNVDYIRGSAGGPVRRDQSASLDSRCSYYVEDRLSLVPELRLDWERHSYGDLGSIESRRWRFQFALKYDLSRALF